MSLSGTAFPLLQQNWRLLRQFELTQGQSGFSRFASYEDRLGGRQTCELEELLLFQLTRIQTV